MLRHINRLPGEIKTILDEKTKRGHELLDQKRREAEALLEKLRGQFDVHGKHLNPAWQAFRIITSGSRRRPDVPDNIPGAFAFGDPVWQDHAYPNARVEGWAARGPSPRGTLIISHGFCEHSVAGYCLGLTARAYHDHGWSVAGVDLRCHGRSHDGCPTFGIAESWDLGVVLDFLIARGFPGPFVVAGMSLGAMAGANLAVRDRRIAGAFLVNQPASPRQAVDAQIAHHAGWLPAPLKQAGKDITEQVNVWYNRDVLGEGDITRVEHPNWPLVVTAMGTHDHFGIDKTRNMARTVWGEGDEIRVQPGQAGEWDGRRPLFITCEGGHHASNMWDYPVLASAFDQLLRSVP